MVTNIVDPSNIGFLGFDSFREGIPQVINSSLRVAPSDDKYATAFKFYSASVAFLNFAFVMILASEKESLWIDNHRYSLSLLILVLCCAELLVKSNLIYCCFDMKLARMHKAFDGISYISLVISMYGKSSNVFFFHKLITLIYISRNIHV